MRDIARHHGGSSSPEWSRLLIERFTLPPADLDRGRAHFVFSWPGVIM